MARVIDSCRTPTRTAAAVLPPRVTRVPRERMSVALSLGRAEAIKS